MAGIILLLLALYSQAAAGDKKPETLDAYFKSFARGGQMKPVVHDSWVSADKGYHIIASMMTTVFIGQFSIHGLEMDRGKAQYAGAGAGFAIGLTKEFYDAKKPDNKFSWKDLTADGLGILIGFLITGIH
jgi:uncharacterized protein YfiM (DUF2279 family)